MSTPQRPPLWIYAIFVFATGAIAIGALGAAMHVLTALDPVGAMLADDHNPDPQMPSVDDAWAFAESFSLLALAGAVAYGAANRMLARWASRVSM